MNKFTIGKCRTGKFISSTPEMDNLLTFEEIFDAMAVLSLVAIKESRRYGENDISRHLKMEIEKLDHKLIESKQWENQMKIVGATTSFDINRYAERLLGPKFNV